MIQYAIQALPFSLFECDILWGTVFDLTTSLAFISITDQFKREPTVKLSSYDDLGIRNEIEVIFSFATISCAVEFIKLRFFARFKDLAKQFLILIPTLEHYLNSPILHIDLKLHDLISINPHLLMLPLFKLLPDRGIHHNREL